ncbi:MAG TPA: NAD(P)-dependent oxidoreductase [Thermoleophilaceae bacterium]|nr:NAD(P)-dependent oxidoreductase [Thermoleophilaceae bacterium]
MKILVAGATGALGRQLVPRLVERGHEVTGMTRRDAKRDLLRSLGATPVVADALDPDAVARAVAEAEPEVVVHQLTALAGGLDARHIERTFAMTNRLRTEGTDHLLAAARAVGARRFVAQSFAGWPYARDGAPVKSEDEPLDPDPPRQLRTTHAAIRHLEQAVTGAGGIEGVVLRYGGFYGPGTSMALEPEGEQVAEIRARKFPVVGDGGGVWSFVHVADAAEATALAIERGAPGIYNVVDDSPAPVREWLPATAEAIGAKRPLRVPRFVGRLAAGEAATVMMTEVRGASNAKAKRELGWQPRHRSMWESLAGEARG